MERKRIFVTIETDGKEKRVENWGKEHVLGLLRVMKDKRADLYAVVEEHFADRRGGVCDEVGMCMELSVGEMYGTACNKAVVSFNSVLTDAQMGVLVELVNELHIFTKKATVEVLAAFFRCEMTGLKVRNLRLFCALMTALSNHRYISYYWQAPIYRERLLLAYKKKAFVNRSDLTTANYEVKNILMDERMEKIEAVIRVMKKERYKDTDMSV